MRGEAPEQARDRRFGARSPWRMGEAAVKAADRCWSEASYQQAVPSLCGPEQTALNRLAMEQARMDRAMKRIEDALARIEATAEARQSENTGGDADFYGELQSRVRDTLVELDGVIADLER